MVYGLQQLRKTPKTTGFQTVLDWTMALEGAQLQMTYQDEHANTVDLISFLPETEAVVITCVGEVDVIDTNGVIGKHAGFMPMWIFGRSTRLTQPGSGVRTLARLIDKNQGLIDQLHQLSQVVRDTITYETGQTDVSHSAEEAIAAGKGVCQDHAHVFISAARLLGCPARYVSGYLMLQDRVEQEASHAWAEAHVDGLGWIGFDIANGIAPDSRYVRVATGLDYADAAPVSGVRFGPGDEHMQVHLEIQQQ